MHSVIEFFRKIVFTKGWKPLNYGFVITTTSFCDVVEFLFRSGFEFVLGHRFTQDATENIISQIRNKEGKLPSALKALRAIKCITVSQYVSDVKNTSYLSESDEFLLDFCKGKPKRSEKNTSDEEMIFNVKTYTLNDFETNMSAYNANSIFYIAGSTTLSVGKKAAYFDCVAFLYQDNLPENAFVQQAKAYTDSANQGGLRYPCLETFLLALHCEIYFEASENYLQRNQNKHLISSLIEFVKIDFPPCLNVKEKIVRHYFNVRSFCVKSFTENSKTKKKEYGSASMK